MRNKVANPKSLVYGSILLALTLTVHTQSLSAAAYDPVCEVNQNSGYCSATPPVGSLISTATVGSVVSSPCEFGTFNRPFSVNSLWNSRPTKVILGNSVIPESTYYPLVATGNYSTTAFLAKETDLPMTVYPPDGAPGVWDPDSEAYFPSITIPRWPSETVPASGSDGHADIVDAERKIIHSFFQLKNTNGRWTATQYAWSRIDGRGWGDGAHYFQGARAAGIPPMAGLIRKHEINDGASQYHHALAMSLTYTGMSGTEQYVFPATSGDRTFTQNSGQIPTGALLMLPPSFDSASITSPALRKVVNTLKTYGAYVIDRNVGTPFYIYVENGSNFNLHEGGWNSTVAKDLQTIRAALRPVIYAKDWVNGLGQPITSQPRLNMLSMRGPWRSSASGGVAPAFNSYSQSVVFTNTTKAEYAENASGRSISGVDWAKPIPGKLYEFRVEATNNGKAYLRFWGGGKEQFNSRPLANGETYRFYWPSVSGTPIMGVVSGVGPKTEIRGVLTQVQ
ncbi:MAG: Atrophin-1 multi-domain protein [Burkholderiales bacterium]|jgi:hypothetical protein|uniref:Atrophin-1 multi-domain protein n=1 Tax=Limnobacter sp. TaxID=2003368 RepID=UPI0039BD765A|nr:Atrophin-1 multi-domain protein [Burkholderiales bacterium]